MTKRAVPELKLTDYARGDATAKRTFSEALMRGLKEYGFIILKEHAVSADLLARAYRLAEQVFGLDVATKKRYAAGMRGYTPFGIEHAKDNAHPDLKEFWQIGHSDAPGFADNVWPREAGDFKATYQELFDRLNETGMILLRALAPELGLLADYFDQRVRFGTSILRVLHYPPLAPGTDPRAVRSAAHEDINLMTLMPAARGAGLELLDRDGRWLAIESAADDLIVDSGDMLARMTNGVIPATTHRVVNPQGPNVSRYSMPFFMHPTLATSLAVLPSCVGDGRKFPDTTAGDFLDERLRAIGMA